MTARQVLQKAKRLIQRRGWVQGQFGNELVGYCVHGAICAAVKGSVTVFFTRDLLAVQEAERRLENAIPVNRKSPTLAAWNDKPGRRKLAVLRAFDRAIKSAPK